MHEHIFIDLTKQVIVAGMLNDPGLMAAELSEFWRLGGRTVVDCTTRTIGREPGCAGNYFEDDWAPYRYGVRLVPRTIY